MRRTRRKGRHFSQRGVALLAAVMAIAVTSVMVKEFATNTTIDFIAATNARESMKAHFHARSGANLAQLLIRVQTDVLDRYRNFLGDVQIGDYANLLMGAFGGTREEVGALGDMIGVDVRSVEGLGLDEGSFDVQITSEDGKINLNCANGSVAVRQRLAARLEAMFYPVVFNRLFESPSADGWRRDRAEQVAAIIDYIDLPHIDPGKFGNPGAPEDYGYESLRDPYKAKDNYLDTVLEAKLIRGIDDRFWTLFGNQFTVYGSDCRQNLAAITDAASFASLIMLSAANPDDPVLRDYNRLWLLAKTVADARALGFTFDEANTFAEFVRDPMALMGMMGPMQPDGMSTGTQPVQGVELDINKLNQIAKTGARTVYRVQVVAHSGRITKRLEAVWDTTPTNQNARDPVAYGRGAWVYWRED
jgi:type II secretory pathway component PulK